MLILSCPNSGVSANYHGQVNLTISVDWTRPDGVEILTTFFESVCLKGNDTNTDHSEPEVHTRS